MLYCSLSKSFRKSFLSIKGIYYQVEIMGQQVTWVQPYKFTQKLPFDIDYKVMMTFLDFYLALQKFINFKLFNDVGLQYPPERMDQTGKDNNQLDMAKVRDMQKNVCETLYGNEEKQRKQIEEEFGSAPELEEMKLREEKAIQMRSLLEGKVFYLNPEIPTYSLEFLLVGFGGEFGYSGDETEYKKTSEEVTHIIMDRPLRSNADKTKEHVIPQWVYDSINNQLLLPPTQYVPGQPAPAHLSPFIDNKEEGYLPERQQELNEMKGVTQEVYEPEVSDEEKSEDEADEEDLPDAGDEDSSNESEDETI